VIGSLKSAFDPLANRILVSTQQLSDFTDRVVAKLFYMAEVKAAFRHMRPCFVISSV